MTSEAGLNMGAGDQRACQVQLCFGRVAHSRLRPVPHVFQQSVYFIRLPLRSIGQGSFGLRFFSRNRFNLLSFCDNDYGDGKQPLIDWIDGFLKAEGIVDANGEIWLQTFPRVLGYVFNPVSFWFCHTQDGALRAVLCEVRNTFGERHCYLLDTNACMPYGIELRAKKEFHVSPFCHVEGGYRFRFMRSTQQVNTQQVNTQALESTVARIDYDDASGPLLLTNISGVGRVMKDGAVLRAFFSYPLMTFWVITNIHWHAFRLWLKRVPFISKPAPPEHEVTR